jgi:hypothetical protein
VSLSAEAIYLQLGQLVSEMPDLGGNGLLPAETQRWLGRVVAMVELVSPNDSLIIKVATQGLYGPMRDGSVQMFKATVYAALARAELQAPAAVQGAFVPAGGAFDIFAAFGKVMGEAKSHVLIVDPYADEIALRDFAVLAPERVSVRLLADKEFRKPTLKPAAERWATQHGQVRPLEVRLAAAKTLHDRLMIIDGATVWNFGQSLNMIATRAHTSIDRAGADTADMKLKAYEAIWASADPL